MAFGLSVAHFVSLAAIALGGIVLLNRSPDAANCPVRLTAFLMRRFYLITRDLHLYVGLFLSPFVLVFSVSVFYLVHGLAQRPAPDQPASSRTVNDLGCSTRPRRHAGARTC